MDIAAERSYPTPFANAALLPMLLLSLARQKHTPNTAKVVNSEYDYIVVGAGSAGSVVASRLSEMPCVSVLLLEAGKAPPLLTDVPAIARSFRSTDIDWNYKTAPQKYTGALLKNRQVAWPSGKTIGGSSVLNGMLYVRGNPLNFDDWAADGAHGWSYKDVLPYFFKMEDNRDMEYVDNGFHGVGGPQTVHRPRYKPEIKDPIFRAAKSLGYKIVDPNAGSQTGFFDLQATLRAGQRCSTAKSYLVPAENRTNLDILPNAMVRKVLIDNRRAIGTQFDFDGNTYEVKARREVIVSAGTVNTAQLLMLSGIGPRKELQRFKIPVIADLPVGRNLQDHCASSVNFELSPSIKPLQVKLRSPASTMQYIQNRTGPLGSPEFFNNLAFLKNGDAVPKRDFPDHGISLVESSSEFGDAIGLTPEAKAQIYDPYEGKPMYTCIAELLHPRSRGTVTLKSTDPYDPPIIDPNYFDDPKDIDDIVEGLKVCNRIGTSGHMQKVGSMPFRTLIPGCEKHIGDENMYLWCQVKSIIFSTSDPVGTARMGHPEDPRAVVDPLLRVKSIDGLRIVDSSVMPIIPSGSTNIPTIMIAEKASDIIKNTVECHNILKNEDHSSKTIDSPSTEHQYNPMYQDINLADLMNIHEEKVLKHIHDSKLLEEILSSQRNIEGNNELKKEAEPKVKPWNKEVPNVAPWNSEFIQPFLTDEAPEFNGNLLLFNNHPFHFGENFKETEEHENLDEAQTKVGSSFGHLSSSPEKPETNEQAKNLISPQAQTKHQQQNQEYLLSKNIRNQLLSNSEKLLIQTDTQTKNLHKTPKQSLENSHSETLSHHDSVPSQPQSLPENSYNQQQPQKENSREKEQPQSQKSLERPQPQTTTDEKQLILEKIRNIETQMKNLQLFQTPLRDILQNEILKAADQISKVLPSHAPQDKNRENSQAKPQAVREIQQNENGVNDKKLDNQIKQEKISSNSQVQPQKLQTQLPNPLISIQSQNSLHETPVGQQEPVNLHNRPPVLTDISFQDSDRKRIRELLKINDLQIKQQSHSSQSPTPEDVKKQILLLARVIAKFYPRNIPSQENSGISPTRHQSPPREDMENSILLLAREIAKLYPSNVPSQEIRGISPIRSQSLPAEDMENQILLLAREIAKKYPRNTPSEENRGILKTRPESSSREDLKNQILFLTKEIAKFYPRSVPTEQIREISPTLTLTQEARAISHNQMPLKLSHNVQIAGQPNHHQVQQANFQNRHINQNINILDQFQSQLDDSRRQKQLGRLRETPRTQVKMLSQVGLHQQAAGRSRNVHRPVNRTPASQSGTQNNLQREILKLARQIANSSPSNTPKGPAGIYPRRSQKADFPRAKSIIRPNQLQSSFLSVQAS